MRPLASFILTLCLTSALGGKDVAGNDDSACLDSADDSGPKCVGKGEKWLDCGEFQYCDPVCGRLDEPCTRRYIQCPSGCQCPKGYAQIPETRDCVKEEECPKEEKKCPKNMHWDECATVCTDHCLRELIDCKPECTQRCVCDSDFAMSKNNVCIPRSECDQEEQK